MILGRSESLKRYLQSTRLHCRPRTIRTSEAAVRRLTDFFGDAPAAELSRSDCDRYSAERMAKGVGPHTPNRDLACLRAAFTQAKDDSLLDRVPKIRMLRTVQGMPRLLTPEEIRHLIERGEDLRPLLATAASSGLRAAELRWLWWENVDLESGEIAIRSKLDWRPKTHCERAVPIPNRLTQLLLQHRETVIHGPNDWVFPVPSHGGQWTESGLSHTARRVAEKAGLWRQGAKSLHDLRRSWASHLLAAGTPMDTVRRLGGWASNATLERFYVAPTEAGLKLAVEASSTLL
jgi:integrase